MAIPTIAETINIGRVSGYLAANDNALGALFGTRKAAPGSALTITMVTYGLDWGNAGGAQTSASLRNVANYLIWLCGQYGQQAQNILSISGGGSVIPGGGGSGGTSIYPFIITSADFEPDGISYDNPDIVGDNLTIFINEYTQQWLVASSSTFSYTATGIIINIPDFNANINSWTIMIQKLNS